MSKHIVAMKRWIFFLLVFGWSVSSGAAQPLSLLPQGMGPFERPSSWTSSAAAEKTDARRAGYLESFGGGLLGAAIGGGLGLLVGSVPREELFGERERRYGRDRYDEDDEVTLLPLGVWAGSMVGAMAGGRTGVRGDATAIVGLGSGFGSLLGLGAFAVASNGRGPWSIAGFGIGAAAGAAFGAVVLTPEYRGLVHRNDERWTVGPPAVQWQPALHDRGTASVRVTLISARF